MGRGYEKLRKGGKAWSEGEEGTGMRGGRDVDLQTEVAEGGPQDLSKYV